MTAPPKLPLRAISPDLPENAITERVIKCAIAVDRQLKIPVLYRGKTIGEYKPDMVIDDLVVVEIRSVERFDPVFEAQVLTYLRITGKRVGLLINFNSRLVKDGVKRFVL